MAVYRRPQVAVRAPGGLATPAAGARLAPEIIAVSERRASAKRGEVAFGFLVFVGVWVIAWTLPDSKVVFEPPQGLGAFAVFFVIAAAIERFLEVSDRVWERILMRLGDRESKADLEILRDQAIEAADTAAEEEAKEKGMAAAVAQSEVDEATKGRTAAMAGVAGALGIALAAYFNANFLKAIGITGAGKWVALLITGLVVAGGTKQLHDLLTYMSIAKEQKSTPAATGGTAA